MRFLVDFWRLFDENIFEQNCSMCHSLHHTKEFSANQWPSMFKSMAMRTGIDKKDYYLVIEYLQKHAKDIANTAMVNIEKYKGKHLELSAFMPPKGA